ncbi:MAG: DUF58 domain-containing protein, partial [Deltaproteobacteria bacterium]|nr:DUF58 domain-containing protein [Deltaproteobacteria bacterium]
MKKTAARFPFSPLTRRREAPFPPAGEEAVPGVYVTLAELVRCRHQTAGFSLLPRQPARSLLAGRYGSRLRGRGLDFKELRQYRPGDDIRIMDWKATRRTGHPYVRVYAEERERAVLLLVDQRLSMFFGSRVRMKSVTAAEAAALLAWRVVGEGDRVGALVFNDGEISEVKPRRRRQAVMQVLHHLVRQNRALGVDRRITPSREMLDRVLEKAVQLAGHDYLVCVISDFFGLSDQSLHQVKLLSRHNDVMLLPVYDPLARELPADFSLVISDGRRQLLLDARDRRLRKRFPEFLQNRLRTLAETLGRFGVPVLP